MEIAPPDPRIGMVLQGRYAILERVASGAMGVVYRGERVSLGRAVAVKFLHPWIASQQAFRARFETEARAMSRLSHPNCASVIDFGVEGASPYVVMDFIAGITLRQLLGSGRLAPARAVAIGRQLLAGVAHAHAQNIVHRDLKPENLILGDTAGLADHVRILDFGLAKLRDGPALTSGLALGTPSYMSPEQTGSPGDIDGRTDIYAVGVLMFEMLAGRKPFVADKVAEILVMHRDTPPPRLRQAVPEAGISEALEAVVDRALAKSPAARFQTAGEFAEALARVPEGGGTGYAHVPVPATQAVGDGVAVANPGGRPVQIGPSLEHPVNQTLAQTVADLQHFEATVIAVEPSGSPSAPAPASRLAGGAVVPERAAPAVAAPDPGSGRARGGRDKGVWVGLGGLGVLALILVAIGVRGRSGTPASPRSPAPPAPRSSAASGAVPAPAPVATGTGPTTGTVRGPGDGRPAPPPRTAPAPPAGASLGGSGKLATHAVTVGGGAGKGLGTSGGREPADRPPPAGGERAPSTSPVAAEERFREADALMEKGEWEPALVLLEKARKENPKRADAAYRLANAALEHKRWSEGAEAARAAAVADPKYRSDERLVRNLIRSFVSDRGYERSESVLEGFGAGAVPLLREAAAHDESRVVRQRAGEILESRGGASRSRAAATVTSSARPASRPASRPFFSR